MDGSVEIAVGTMIDGDVKATSHKQGGSRI
jgi:hypothetical protein